MEADFRGYATKAGLVCSDGRTIMPNAFAHQDKETVPLVWQHGHNEPTNVLGHAVLENREDGVYAYGFFNDSEHSRHIKHALSNGDIRFMSIWANDLIERAKHVVHGAIREVSLVLSGANPGAVIEHVHIQHGEGYEDTVLESEAVISTGLEIEGVPSLAHADGENSDAAAANDSGGDDRTIQDVVDSMTDEQREVLHYLVGEALDVQQSDDDGETFDGDAVDDSGDSDTVDDPETQDDPDTGDSVSDPESSGDDPVEHFNTKEGTSMTRNVFDQSTGSDTPTLSHSDIKGIVSAAQRSGSLKHAVEEYALSHGIDNIGELFPDAKTLGSTPEWDSRRMEWVQSVIGRASKSPFSRVRTMSADITMEEARAKGYLKGEMKKEEFFSVQRRSTTPTTIYKKQKIDRDDMVDITDFDVVMWLKGEMRLMLDEEIARAVLIGDGRDPASDDKINEGNIRPIAKEHELYATTINVNLADANSSAQEIIDAVVRARRYYKGSGTPTFYTTESVVSEFLLLKDGFGRKMYSSLDEVARELRVDAVVPVEVMEGEADLIGIIVNMADYVIGADAGGQVSMFDDFDIDYNQYKYLIETRISGALTKLKSALVLRAMGASDLLIATSALTAPTFDPDTGVVTIPTVTNVAFYNQTVDPEFASELTAGAQAALDPGESVTIVAVADPGYFFENSAVDNWTFTRNHA